MPVVVLGSGRACGWVVGFSGDVVGTVVVVLCKYSKPVVHYL